MNVARGLGLRRFVRICTSPRNLSLGPKTFADLAARFCYARPYALPARVLWQLISLD